MEFSLYGLMIAVFIFLIWFWNSLYVIKEWERGVVLRRVDAGDWRPEPSLPTLSDLEAVRAIDDTRVFAVGGNGTVIERQADGGWLLHPVFTTQDLTSIWASGPNDVWVGAWRGELWHYDGANWAQEQPPGIDPTMDIFSIWGWGTTDLFLVANADDQVHSYGAQFDGGFVFHYLRH